MEKDSSRRGLFPLGLLWLSLFSPLWATHVYSQPRKQTWDFDRDTPGKPAAGFIAALTGRGAPGEWVVRKDPSAPSPSNVLSQTNQDKTDYRFPLAIAEGTNYKDFVLSVKFKAISGTVDQGAGLVFRWKDKDNYYVVRANALENNFRLYRVVSGNRLQFAGAEWQDTPRVWHEIKVEARGDELQCYFDGQLRITAQDKTFPEAGKIGLWTKADSLIYFDDLTVQDLGSGKSPLPTGKTRAQKLVDELAMRHPEIARIGLHLTPPGAPDNIIIASNIPAKIGQRSDPEDLKAMQSSTAVVLKEGTNFDVTLPLHDATGRIIGAIGLTLSPKQGEREADVVKRAIAIAQEFEKQIPSKETLF